MEIFSIGDSRCLMWPIMDAFFEPLLTPVEPPSC